MTTDLISTNIGITKIWWSFFYFKNWLFERILWWIKKLKNTKIYKQKFWTKKFVYDNDSDLFRVY